MPWLQPLHGRHEVPKFFEALAEHMDLRRFEPKVIVESGDVVLVLFEAEAWSRRTGRRIPETEAAHIWHFDANGLAIRYKNAVDSYGASAALS